MSESYEKVENQVEKLLQQFSQTCEKTRFSNIPKEVKGQDERYKYQINILSEYFSTFEKDIEKHAMALDEIDIFEAKDGLKTLSLYEQILFMQKKILLRGTLILMHDLKNNSRNLSSKASSFNESLIMLQVLITIIKSESNVLVLSIGSYRSEQQQFPTFAKQLAMEQSVDIFNFDPMFSYSPSQEKIEKFGTKHTYPITIRENYPLDPLLNSESKKTYELLLQTISYILNHTKKTLVIVSSISPELNDNVIQIVKLNINNVGDNLQIIGSYWDGFPSTVFSKAFFQKDNPKKFQVSTLIKGWEAFEKEYKEGSYEFPKEVLEEWSKVTTNSGIGTLYANLTSIPANSLVKTFAPKSKP